MPDPRIFGAAPLDPGLNDEHPFRGASPDDLGGYPSHPSRKSDAPDIPPARSRLPDPVGAKPRRDHRFLDRVSRHEVPKTPGNDDAFKVYDPARVSHIPVSQPVRHPGGVEEREGGYR